MRRDAGAQVLDRGGDAEQHPGGVLGGVAEDGLGQHIGEVAQQHVPFGEAEPAAQRGGAGLEQPLGQADPALRRDQPKRRRRRQRRGALEPVGDDLRGPGGVQEGVQRLPAVGGDQAFEDDVEFDGGGPDEAAPLISCHAGAPPRAAVVRGPDGGCGGSPPVRRAGPGAGAGRVGGPGVAGRRLFGGCLVGGAGPGAGVVQGVADAAGQSAQQCRDHAGLAGDGRRQIGAEAGPVAVGLVVQVLRALPVVVPDQGLRLVDSGGAR